MLFGPLIQQILAARKNATPVPAAPPPAASPAPVSQLQELMTMVRDRTLHTGSRQRAMLLLGQMEGIPQAAKVLGEVANTPGEPLEIRVIALTALASVGGPDAAAAMKRAMMSKQATEEEVPNPNGAGQVPLSFLIGEMMGGIDAGRAALDEVIATPEGNVTAWTNAVFSRHGESADDLVRVTGDKIRDMAAGAPFREAAVMLLGTMLETYRTYPGSAYREGRELLISVSLAKSEVSRIRELAAKMLRQLPE